MNPIFEDDNFIIYLHELNLEKEVWLEVKKPSLPLSYLESVCRDFPRIKISNFISVKKAFEIPNTRADIGVFKPLYEITTSKDEMIAYLDINMTNEDFKSMDIKLVKTEIISVLNQTGIKEGINVECISESMESLHKIVVARGIEAISGTDAKINYFEISEKKPTLKNDGNVDNYEMNLIDKIERGGWLGEKILPTHGMPGKTIYGNILLAKPGRDYKLKYDKKSVEEINE